MININKKYIITIFAVIIFAALPFVILDIYTWSSHGYDSDYRLRQKCIEVSPMTSEEEAACEELRES